MLYLRGIHIRKYQSHCWWSYGTANHWNSINYDIDFVTNYSYQLGKYFEQFRIHVLFPKHFNYQWLIRVIYLLYGFQGSKFKVLGAICNDSKLCYGHFIWYYILFYIPWTNFHRWQTCIWTNRENTIFYRNGTIFTWVGWCCKCRINRRIVPFISANELNILHKTFADNAIGKWNENTEIVCRNNGYTESSIRCYYFVVPHNGCFWLLEIWK